jgi:hypothetical protein
MRALPDIQILAPGWFVLLYNARRPMGTYINSQLCSIDRARHLHIAGGIGRAPLQTVLFNCRALAVTQDLAGSSGI